MPNAREPIFNLPATMVAAVAVLTAIHVVRLVFSVETDIWIVFAFGFVPARFAIDPFYGPALPGGPGADVWTFFSYALLHGSWMHLGVNVAWMVAFGTPVLRRFGRRRFLALSAAAAAAGALAHLFTHWGEFAPVIGASAAISGQMGAAVRFAFQRPAPGEWHHPGDDTRWKRPALPLVAAFRDIRVVAFVGIWFAVNYVFGAGGVVGGEEAPIAWEAHMGGFLLGLLAFRLFDPPPPAPAPAHPGDQNNGSW